MLYNYTDHASYSHQMDLDDNVHHLLHFLRRNADSNISRKIKAYTLGMAANGNPGPLGVRPATMPMLPWQQWMTVGMSLPLFLILYLLVIFLTYQLYCSRSSAHDELHIPMPEDRFDPNASRMSPGEVTPPPSYAIFIGSGDSAMIPPTYKMLYPRSRSSTEDHASPTEFVSHSNVILELGGQLSTLSEEIFRRRRLEAIDGGVDEYPDAHVYQPSDCDLFSLTPPTSSSSNGPTSGNKSLATVSTVLWLSPSNLLDSDPAAAVLAATYAKASTPPHL